MTRKSLVIWSIAAVAAVYGTVRRLEEYQMTGMLNMSKAGTKMYLSGIAAEATLFGLFIIDVVIFVGLFMEFRKTLRAR